MVRMAEEGHSRGIYFTYKNKKTIKSHNNYMSNSNYKKGDQTFASTSKTN